MNPTPADTVTIPAARLAALEALEASLPQLLADAAAAAVAADKQARLTALRGNPAVHKEKMLQKYHANKEAINARRRAAYAAKRAAAAGPPGSS